MPKRHFDRRPWPATTTRHTSDWPFRREGKITPQEIAQASSNHTDATWKGDSEEAGATADTVARAPESPTYELDVGRTTHRWSFGATLLRLFLRFTIARVLLPAAGAAALWILLFDDPPVLVLLTLLTLPLLYDHVISQRGRAAETAFDNVDRATARALAGEGSVEEILRVQSRILVGPERQSVSGRLLFWTGDAPWGLKAFAAFWVPATAVLWLLSIATGITTTLPHLLLIAAAIVLGASHIIRLINLARMLSRLKPSLSPRVRRGNASQANADHPRLLAKVAVAREAPPLRSRSMLRRCVASGTAPSRELARTL